jgi:hypothetical protein
MKALGDLLLKRKRDVKITFSDKDVFYVFDKVIKAEFGLIGITKFKADYFKDKKVFVKSQSSVWSSELMLNRAKIIRKMNDELGEGAIADMKIK